MTVMMRDCDERIALNMAWPTSTDSDGASKCRLFFSALFNLLLTANNRGVRLAKNDFENGFFSSS